MIKWEKKEKYQPRFHWHSLLFRLI